MYWLRKCWDKRGSSLDTDLRYVLLGELIARGLG
jgi:hypothetical protein